MVKASNKIGTNEADTVPYKSILESEAFRKIRYFGDIPRQLFYHHIVKISQKHIFAVLLIHNTTLLSMVIKPGSDFALVCLI